MFFQFSLGNTKKHSGALLRSRLIQENFAKRPVPTEFTKSTMGSWLHGLRCQRSVRDRSPAKNLRFAVEVERLRKKVIFEKKVQGLYAALLDHVGSLFNILKIKRPDLGHLLYLSKQSSMHSSSV